MKFFTTKAFLYLAILVIGLIAINDRHFTKHIFYYIIAAVILYSYWEIIRPFILNKLLVDKVSAIVKAHETPLSIQRNKLVKKDIYGNEFEKRWQEEIIYFIKNTIYKQLNGQEKDILEYEYPYEKIVQFFGYINPYQKILQIIDAIAKEKNIHYEQNITYYETMTGEEYEMLCKDILTKSGWIVDTTKKTGDQGVDLIATKNNIRVAIQCKRYSNNIGNSAVQEIVSGKILYKANFGVVVSNVPYTKSAIELANAANIKLLHHYHLVEEDFYVI